MFGRVDGGDDVDIGKATARQSAASSVDTRKINNEWVFGDISGFSFFNFGDNIKGADYAETIFINIIVGEEGFVGASVKSHDLISVT